MKLLGFTVQKPLYQAFQQDQELVRQREVKTYPAIRSHARTEGATIYFADESGLRSDYPPAPHGFPKANAGDRNHKRASA